MRTVGWTLHAIFCGRSYSTPPLLCVDAYKTARVTGKRLAHSVLDAYE